MASNYLSPLNTKLDAAQVIRRAYDETNNRLRVDAQVTATIGTVDVIIDAASGDNIKISDGTNTLVVNPDGSINVVASVTTGLPANASTASNQVLEITELQTANTTLNTINSKLTAPLTVSLPTNAATESTLQSLLTELTQKTEPTDVQNIRAFDVSTDSISVPEIDAKLPTLGPKPSSGSVSVTLASDQLLDVNLEAFTGVQPDNVQLVGSIDGTKTGSKYGFVNNIRQQIISSHDREQDITYSDFGTKDQRVIRIDYTSPTFPGIIARKDIAYTLVGNRYRRDNIQWTII